MKIIKKNDEDTSENELNHMLTINHENILRYFDHFDHLIDYVNNTCIIYEFCEVRRYFFLVYFNSG